MSLDVEKMRKAVRSLPCPNQTCKAPAGQVCPGVGDHASRHRQALKRGLLRPFKSKFI